MKHQFLLMFVLGCLAFGAAPYASAHQGHLSDAPWRACDGVELGESCAFENSAHDIYPGTCRSISGGMMCVRNQPIVRAAQRKSEFMASTAPKALNHEPKPVGIGLAATILAISLAISAFGWRAITRSA